MCAFSLNHAPLIAQRPSQGLNLWLLRCLQIALSPQPGLLRISTGLLQVFNPDCSKPSTDPAAVQAESLTHDNLPALPSSFPRLSLVELFVSALRIFKELSEPEVQGIEHHCL